MPDLNQQQFNQTLQQSSATNQQQNMNQHAEEELLNRIKQEQNLVERRQADMQHTQPASQQKPQEPKLPFRPPKMSSFGGSSGGSSFLIFFVICILSNLFDYFYSLGLNTITILVDVVTFILLFLVFSEIDKKLLAIPFILELFYARFSTVIAASFGFFSPLFVKLPFWFLFAVLYLFMRWNDDSFLSQKTKDVLLVLFILVGVFFTFPHLQQIELQNITFLDDQQDAYQGMFETIGDRAQESSSSVQGTVAEQICRMSASWNSLLNQAPPPCMEQYELSDPSQENEELKDTPLMLDAQFRMQILEPESIEVGKPIFTYIVGYNELDHEVIVDLRCGIEQPERSRHREGILSEEQLVLPAGDSFRQLIECNFEESPDFAGEGIFYVEATARRLDAFTLRTLLITTEQNIQSRIRRETGNLDRSNRELVEDVFSEVIGNYELRERSTNDYLIALSKIGEELVSEESASPIIGVSNQDTSSLAFKAGIVNNYEGPQSNTGMILQIRDMQFTIPDLFSFSNPSCGYNDETYFARRPIEFVRSGFANQYFFDPCRLQVQSTGAVSSFEVTPYELEIQTSYDYTIRMETEAAITDLPGYYRGISLISPLQEVTRQQISPSSFPQYKFNRVIDHSYIEIPSFEGEELLAVADGYIRRADTIGNFNSICIEHGDPDYPGAKAVTRYSYMSDDFMSLGETIQGTFIEQGTLIGYLLPLDQIRGIKKDPLMGTPYDSLVRFAIGYGSCDSAHWEDPMESLLPLVTTSPNEMN